MHLSILLRLRQHSLVCLNLLCHTPWVTLPETLGSYYQCLTYITPMKMDFQVHIHVESITELAYSHIVESFSYHFRCFISSSRCSSICHVGWILKGICAIKLVDSADRDYQKHVTCISLVHSTTQLKLGCVSMTDFVTIFVLMLCNLSDIQY